MNSKNLLLGVFVMLTVVFASLTLVEYSQVNTLNSEQSKSASTPTLTTTITSTETSVSTTTQTATTTTQAVTTTTEVETSTITMTSPASCPSNTTCGSFTYTPIGQVQVDSVQATQQNENGGPATIFAVTFENAGNAPVYISDGSNGVSTSVPANSSVLQEVSSARCAGTFAIAKLNPGQNYTLYGPSCETGFDFELAQAGSVKVTFSFNWTTATNPTDFPNSTTISAQFIFP